MKYFLNFGAIALSMSLIFGCVSAQQKSEISYPVPLGLPNIPWPEDNPYEPKKSELGRILYFDKRLSSNNTISCSTCHQIKRAFTDVEPVSRGIHGHLGTRHSPTLVNCAYNRLQFWDGRASSLEAQCLGPISNPAEMSNETEKDRALDDCAKCINKIPGYRLLFKEVFGDEEATIQNIAKAIATFERTVLSGNSPYDRYKAGDKTALTSEQIHGMQVFQRAGCANCHFGFNFTDGRFTNIGIGMDKENPDLGRYDVTKDSKDWGAFKIPTLREIALTTPYMHDGRFTTLEEVIDYYDEGGIANKNLHPLMKPLHLTAEDKQALLRFLEGLCGEGWQHFGPPKQFPQ